MALYAYGRVALSFLTFLAAKSGGQSFACIDAGLLADRLFAILKLRYVSLDLL